MKSAEKEMLPNGNGIEISGNYQLSQ